MTVTRYSLQLTGHDDGTFTVGINQQVWRSSAWRSERPVIRRVADEATFKALVLELANHLLLLESERLTEAARP